MTDREILELILNKVGVLDNKVDNLEHKMDNLETKVDSLETKVDSLETKVSSLETEVNNLANKVNSLETEVNGLKVQVVGLNNRVDILDSDMKEVKQRVQRIDLTIENEIRGNIKAVAEGHLDLARNLHDATKPGNEVEMLSIRVSVLETDMKEVKQKVS